MLIIYKFIGAVNVPLSTVPERELGEGDREEMVSAAEAEWSQQKKRNILDFYRQVVVVP